MYKGWAPNGRVTQEWIDNAQDFMDEAFRKVKGPKDSKTIWCPCRKCGNSSKRTKEVMAPHLHNFGFTRDYSKWTFHNETCHMRSEAVRQRIGELDSDAGVADMLHDFHEAHFQGERPEEEPEPSAKAYYDMLAAAKKPLHKHTKQSQLDSIGCLMAVKSQHNLSRECFDALVTVISECFPKITFCQRTCMKPKKSFVHLRCHTRRYMHVRMDVSYSGKIMRKPRTIRNVKHLSTLR
jgi:hypothetical protein